MTIGDALWFFALVLGIAGAACAVHEIYEGFRDAERLTTESDE